MNITISRTYSAWTFLKRETTNNTSYMRKSRSFIIFTFFSKTKNDWIDVSMSPREERKIDIIFIREREREDYFQKKVYIIFFEINIGSM